MTGDKIISDIELRISELLRLRIKKESQIISGNDAKEIIGKMGRLQNFDHNETKPDKAENLPHKESLKKKTIQGKRSSGIRWCFQRIDSLFQK